MAFIPATNVMQVELIYLWSGQFVENVFHYKAPDTISPTDFADAGASLVSWYDTNLKAKQPTTMSLVEVKMTDLTTAINPVVEYTTGLPIVATNGQPSVPNNVTVVLTKRTALRGRSYRGRFYHPGLTENIVTNNSVESAAMEALVTAYELLIDLTVGAETWPLVVLSRETDKAPRLTAVATEVISITSDGFIDTQRRRLPGRGQ